MALEPISEKPKNAITDAADKGDLATKPADKISKQFWDAEDSFGSIQRPTPTYEPVNGVNWANGESGALDAPGNGAAAAGFSEPIEFVHFGVVYQDGREKFVAAKDPKPVDDMVNYAQVPDNVRAVHFRDALQRETVLLAGFLRSTKLAVKYRHDTTNSSARDKDASTSMGGLAGALGGLSDLTGGATGSKSMISEDELRPFLEELQRIAPTIDGQSIEYSKLHTAGMDLHVLRTTYERWLKRSIEKLDAKPADKGMLDAAASSLNPLGLGGPVAKVAEVIGPILQLVQKWSTVTTDAYFHMTLEYSYAMNGPIITAARLMSEDAIRRSAFPAFSVWMKPPPPPTDPNAPAAPPSNPTLIDKVAAGVKDVENFLKRPVPRCPGTPFLDVAFEEPPPSKEGANAADRKGLEVRSVALPELAARLVAEALKKHGVKLDKLGAIGGYVCDVIVEGSRTVADFLHAVYGVVTTLTVDEKIDEAHMLAAGRTHLVNKLVYLALEKLKVLPLLRSTPLNLNGRSYVDPEALVGQGLHALLDALEPALKTIDPILEFAMYELAADLADARKWCGEHFTMEAYLAILPATYAKLVRHLVFFLVDTILKLVTEKVLNPALAAVGLPGVSGAPGDDDSPLGVAKKLGGGPLGLVGGSLGKAGDLVNRVSNAIRDAQALGNALGKGLDRAEKISKGKYGFGGQDEDNDEAGQSIEDGINDIKNAKGKDKKHDRAGAPETKKAGDDYPFPSRVGLGMGKAITDDELKAVVAEATKRKMKRTGTADSVTAKAAK